VEEYGVTEKEFAVFCASHYGEPFHTEAVYSVLGKIGLDKSYLKCGIHEPTSDLIRIKFREAGTTPGPEHNNCSGKHAGMLATSKLLGYDLEDYTDTTHPLQVSILDAVAEVCDYPAGDIKIGIDGCGAPVHAMPLRKFAQGYARMSKPETLGPGREAAARRITSAMIHFPEMIAGTGDFVTELMRAFGDRLFCKSGANGFFALGLLGKGVGITVKIEDGGSGIMPMIVLETLAQIGAITRDEIQKIPGFAAGKGVRQTIKNHRGDLVGVREPAFELREVLT
jgi:L-asparaginase II